MDGTPDLVVQVKCLPDFFNHKKWRISLFWFLSAVPHTQTRVSILLFTFLCDRNSLPFNDSLPLCLINTDTWISQHFLKIEMWKNCSKRRLLIRFVHLVSVTSRMFLPCFVFLCFKRGGLSPAHPLVNRKLAIWVRKTTCLAGSGKQMATYRFFPLPLFIAE